MAPSLWVTGDQGITRHRVDADDSALEGPGADVVDVIRFGDRFIVFGSELWIGTSAE